VADGLLPQFVAVKFVNEHKSQVLAMQPEANNSKFVALCTNNYQPPAWKAAQEQIRALGSEHKNAVRKIARSVGDGSAIGAKSTHADGSRWRCTCESAYAYVQQTPSDYAAAKKISSASSTAPAAAAVPPPPPGARSSSSH
jgi:hypothetical protein